MYGGTAVANIISSKIMFDYRFVRKLKKRCSFRFCQPFRRVWIGAEVIRSRSVFIGSIRVFEVQTFV